MPGRRLRHRQSGRRMQQNHTSRFALIAAVLIFALYMIFPQPGKLFDSNMRFWEKTNLKPGIDMVGGTSLTYEVKPSGDGPVSSDLSTQVMAALKKRVDPDGVRNLVWRPQGPTRLEIQMPLSDYSGTGKVIREEYANAQRQVEATNVRASEVINAVETLKGDERQTKLDALAMGYDKRAELFGGLRAAYDRSQTAKAAGDLEAVAEASVAYEDLQKKIETDTLSVSKLESYLGLSSQLRQEKLADLRTQYSGFAKRLSAVENFVKSYDTYAQVRGKLDDSADLKRLLKGAGELTFHILVGSQDIDNATVASMRQQLQEKGPGVPGERVKWFPFDREVDGVNSGAVTAKYNEKTYALAWITPENSMTNREGNDPWHMENAYRSQGGMGDTVVGFRFDLAGARLFSQLTRAENRGKLLGAMLDGKIISAATLQATIGREGSISRGGGYEPKDIDYLINTFNAGSLTATLGDEPISERTVGPQLGLQNLKNGLFACGLGLVIVAIFLVAYYYLAGVVAFIAVAMNVLIILGVMAMFNATFTLPGVAGIVLSIGAAVDANVLIFERLREEQQRGLSIRLALQHAYDRAFSAIIDSNATTVITSLLLVWLGSEEVKGFGVTLLIGLVASLFTSLFVTRTIFNLMVEKMNIHQFGSLPLSVPAWDKLLHPKIDWMGKAWIFIVSGVTFILIGCGVFIYEFRQGRLLDIEFASGTAVQFEMKKATPVERIRDTLNSNPATPAVSVVSIGADERWPGETEPAYKAFEVVTPNNDAKEVRDAVLTAFAGELNVTQESKFDGYDRTADAAIDGGVVLPIKDTSLTIDGFKPKNAGAYRGGAAIVLRHLNPKLTPAEIARRIESQRMTPTTNTAPVYSDFVVESPNGDEATDAAVVLFANTNFAFDKGESKWRDNLAGPNWQIVRDAITRPATLQKVSNFNPSVAADAQRDALMAMLLSMLVIMAYIWLRFGNLKYGAATVLAMVHDTLLVIGAVGLTHVIAGTWFGRAILLEEGFRINLTLVAAILTVMSYSMIDTIVVFDRIRENRGKYGHLNRRVINDSINQTMSRTLLTAGTTVVTLMGMYIAGGNAIHGFTFVLLIGILVGTYSSIVIAAPVLLIGADQEAVNAGPQSASGQLSKVSG